MKLKQSFHNIYANIFKDSKKPNANQHSNSNISSIPICTTISQLPHEPIFDNLFQDNKIAEYHLKRSIHEELTNNGLLNRQTYSDIIITKDQSKGLITCELKVIKNEIRIKDIFNIYLSHQSNSILEIDNFLFSSYCRNCEIEEHIYRYIAIVAKEAGYIYLRPSSIIYESNGKFDFSIPDIGDLFGFLKILKESSPKDIEFFKKNAESYEGLDKMLNLLVAPPIDFPLHNLITFGEVISISDIISKTNRKLSEIQKNYLIKMARKLYCQCNQCDEISSTFHGKCVLLSNIVYFLAIEKLHIPDTNNIILDGCMYNKGAHTVAVICGRQVDATADQFMYDGQTLNPYEDNSLNFMYYSCSLGEYEPAMISKYIELFNQNFNKLSIEEFLCNEDNDLYKKSLEIQIFS